MRRRSTIRQLAVVAVAVVVTAGAGCAKDATTTTSATTTPVTLSSSGTSSATEVDDSDFTEVCILIEDMVDNTGDIPDARDRMIEVRAASPEDLEEDWDVILGALDELEQLSPDDDAEAKEIMTAPEVLEAGTRLDDFAADECGVDLEMAEDDLLGESPGTTVASDEPADGEVDPTSSSSLQDHFDEVNSSEAWWPVLEDASAWDRSHGSGNLVQWTVTLSPSIDVESLQQEDLAAACDAMVEYLVQYEEEDVSVEIFDADDNPLVKGFADHPCSER